MDQTRSYPSQDPDAASKADALWEWAWIKHSRSASSIPECEHNRTWREFQRQCRLIQAFGLQAKNRAIITGRQEGMPVTNKQKQQLVIATADMDTLIFVKHFNARHQNDLSGIERLPEDVEFSIEQLYRSFHWRIHRDNPWLLHKHEPDPPEAGIDRAIECLIENHNWGWKEIAGIEGLVAVFPDGKIATRINGVVEHHDTIEDATDRLVNYTNKVRETREMEAKAIARKSKARR